MKPRPLPPIGEAIERPVTDWKAKPAASAFERAKDVAAFANHLGGTLLIGACEEHGRVKAYVGMRRKEAGAVRDDYSKAVSNRCTPRPAIDFEEYDDPGDPEKRIVVINVQPSLNLVGVKVSADNGKEGYGGAAYVFPVRTGIDTCYLEPGQLAMFMTPKIRRIAVMMARMPHNAEVMLSPDNTSHMDCTFVGMLEDENTFTVITNAHITVRYPLDMVESVYQTINGKWVILYPSL